MQKDKRRKIVGQQISQEKSCGDVADSFDSVKDRETDFDQEALTWLEENLIPQADTHSCFRAEITGTPVRAVRATCSEAFNHSIKASLPEVPSILHLQYAIVDRVIPRLHENFVRASQQEMTVPDLPSSIAAAFAGEEGPAQEAVPWDSQVRI